VFSFLVLDLGFCSSLVSVRMYAALTWSVRLLGLLQGFCSLPSLDEVLGLLLGIAFVVL
jgi:hypothetical protein